MTNFISGIEINELFYKEVVAPGLKLNFQNLPYSAALIGWGSDVLGYDDPQSADHNWGLRFQIFLAQDDANKYSRLVNSVLDEQLPSEFHVYPVAIDIVVDEDQRSKA